MNMIGLTVTWHGDRPLNEATSAGSRRGPACTPRSTATSSRCATRATTTCIDREAQQRGESFTGIRGIREQDLAVQEDQRGPISDRSREHLGTADLGVIATRRRLQRQIAAT